MLRTGHKIKGTVRDTAPTVLVTVGVRVSEASFRDGVGAVPYVLDDLHICVRRRNRGKWGRIKENARCTVAGAWDILDSLGAAGRRPYVVCGKAGDTMTLLRWWERVESGEVMVWPKKGEEWQTDPRTGKRRRVSRHPLVISGRPDILGYSVKGCPFRWVSVTNWSDISMAEMAGQVGYPLPPEHDSLDKWECPSWPAADQARVMMHYMTRLTEWWLEIEGGIWKDTPGAASWSNFLRKGGENGIIQHKEEDTLKLEDRAVFGGRAACWWLGDIGDSNEWHAYKGCPFPSGRGKAKIGPVHRFDVRAMYPAILGRERFPVRLMRHAGKLDIRELHGIAKSLCVVAAVTVRSDRGELPRRGQQGTEYPTGSFHTVLTTPEILEGCKRGEIVQCYEAAIYQPGNPFEQWSRWVLNLRDTIDKDTDPASYSLVKTLANSLGGRLGRKRQGWVDQPSVTPREWWGSWFEWDGDTGEMVQYRSLACHVQRMEKEPYRPGTLGACFAHLTAYGRSWMANARECISKWDCYWQDTDGILVNDRGADALRQSPFYHPKANGMLRYEKTFHLGRYITPKHYWLDGRWVLAGIHDGFAVDDGMVSSELLTVNPARRAIRPDNAGISRMVRHVDLSAIDPGVQVGEDGWMIPPVRATHKREKKSGGITLPMELAD